MDVRIKASGINDLVGELRHAADRVSDTARKTMHREADKIVKLAKQMTPVDKHNLEESIKKVVSYGDRGRLQIDIEVGGTIRGVNVDKYAVIIHENYDEMNPGPETMKKQQANPQVIVGRKFLERAMTAHEDKLTNAMISETLKVWKVE